MPKVSVVIVNWNTGALLKKCVASILSLPEIADIRHIIVVDNNSSDDSVLQLDAPHPSPLLSKERGRVVLLRQKENLGFAKANNLAITHIQQHEGQDDHVLLLNPDTEVRTGAIQAMLTELDNNKKAGIVGPKLLNPDNTTQKSVRAFPSFKIFVILFLKLQRIIPKLPSWKNYLQEDFDYEKKQSVNQVMGAAFLIRNAVIKEIGLLDEKFWIWFEEVDYCKRAHDAGWEIIYTPTAEIMHYGGVSFNQLTGPKKTAPFLNSSLVYAKKHLSIFSYTALIILYPFGYIVSFAGLFNRVRTSPSPSPYQGEGNYVPNRVAYFILAIISALFISLFISLQLGLAVIAFSIIAWWVWEYSEEGLLLLIVLSPLLPLLKVTQTLGDITLIKDVVIIALFFKTFLVPLFNKTLPYRHNAFLAPIIALSGWAIIEAIHAPSHILGLLRLRDIILYIMLYFGVLFLSHTKQIMRTRAMWAIATLAIVMALGALQFQLFPDSTVLRFDPVRQVWIPRMGSTFGHPTPFAEFLITAEMLCIGYLIAGYKNIKQKTAVIILLISTLPLLYYTYTRAAWIALVLGVGMIGIAMLFRKNTAFSIKPKHIAITSLILLIVATGILRFSHIGTFLQTAFDPTYASNADRLGFVTQLISQTSNTDAIIGKGLGSSITQTTNPSDITALDITSGDSRTIQLSKDATLVDNQYLKTFIEMGVVGVVFTLWLFWRFLRTSWMLAPKMLGIAG
ncbi:MAG: glycosyltransferase, partial [Candidatus Andersenbacteria bacterium]